MAAERLPRHRELTQGPFCPAPPAAPSDPEPPLPEMVSTADMPGDTKRALWQHLKAHHPERVTFFDDPVVKQLMAAGAVPVFPTEIVRAALRATRRT